MQASHAHTHTRPHAHAHSTHRRASTPQRPPVTLTTRPHKRPGGTALKGSNSHSPPCIGPTHSLPHWPGSWSTLSLSALRCRRLAGNTERLSYKSNTHAYLPQTIQVYYSLLRTSDFTCMCEFWEMFGSLSELVVVFY